MGLLEDILAEVRGEKPSAAGNDPPVVRLTNALLLRMAPENATHVRVITGPTPRMDFRVHGTWKSGPDMRESRVASASRVCAQVLDRLVEMTGTDVRAPCAFGSMYLVLSAPDGDDARPERTAELSSFHLQENGERSIVLHSITGAPMPWTKEETAARDAIHAMMRDAFARKAKGQAKGAVTLIREARERAAKEPTISPIYRADILDALALASEDLGDLAAATDAWIGAITLADEACAKENASSAVFWTELARLELDRGELDAAQAYLERAKQVWEALLDDRFAFPRTQFQSARAQRMRGDHQARKRKRNLAGLRGLGKRRPSTQQGAWRQWAR